MKIFNLILLIALTIIFFVSCAGNSNQVKENSDKPVERFWGHPTDGP